MDSKTKYNFFVNPFTSCIIMPITIVNNVKHRIETGLPPGLYNFFINPLLLVVNNVNNEPE